MCLFVYTVYCRYHVLYIFENFILNGNSLKGFKFESNLSILKISSGVLYSEKSICYVNIVKALILLIMEEQNFVFLIFSCTANGF
jgi:hypothetical protein